MTPSVSVGRKLGYFSITADPYRHRSLRQMSLEDCRIMLGATFGFNSPNKKVILDGKGRTGYVCSTRREKGRLLDDLYVTELILLRVGQRGLQESDLVFIPEYGSEVADGIYLGDRDARNIAKHAESLIDSATGYGAPTFS